jgi:peptidoglycan/xylan/chitin deacetylase (PgdA/CDA1 family)
MTDTGPLIALKIDVDTLQGYLEGVPTLLGVLGEAGVPATFCVAMGPDRSGLAVRRVFTRRGFLRKMLRTRAAATYGWRTMLYGTLLCAPLIASGRPELMRDIEAAGHEVIPHGWDHISWHDFLLRWDMERTRRELRLACEAFSRNLGRPCTAFAAPGWQASDRSLLAQEEREMVYSADTRGWTPFLPLVEGRALRVLQIPTTLPTLDEIIGRPDLKGRAPMDYLLDLIRRPAGPAASGSPGPPIHVYTGHTEIEGARWAEPFAALLAALKDDGFTFVTLARLAESALQNGPPPAYPVTNAELPGRAGTVSCQAGFV